jgi:hypothetical protein
VNQPFLVSQRLDFGVDVNPRTETAREVDDVIGQIWDVWVGAERLHANAGAFAVACYENRLRSCTTTYYHVPDCPQSQSQLEKGNAGSPATRPLTRVETAAATLRVSEGHRA